MESLPNGIFYPVPWELIINDAALSPYAKSMKIETLIQMLTEKGPHVAVGQMGPTAYHTKSFKMNKKVCEHTIYGWSKGTQRVGNAPYQAVILLGAQKTENQKLIFFTLSQDQTLNQLTSVRKYRPLLNDQKIYVTSHKTFKQYLFDIYPPAEEEKDDQYYLHQLCSIQPLESILDRGSIEDKCHAIGQEIFDKYKALHDGDSYEGMKAAQRICEALHHATEDGHLRKQYVEHAWNGIGDRNWTWMA